MKGISQIPTKFMNDTGFISDPVVMALKMEKYGRKNVLKTRKLKKIYNFQMPNAFETLHGINFQVRKGEFVGIMGPSGSGKSTFLNNIPTLDRSTSGTVLINGKDMLTMSDGEAARFRFQNLGYVFQNFNLLKTHTICENIALPLSLNHVNEKETEKRISETAEKAGNRITSGKKSR